MIGDTQVWSTGVIVCAAGIAIAAFSLEKVFTRAIDVWERKLADDFAIADRRLALEWETLNRTRPKLIEPPKRAIVIPPEIEAQLADAPEWEREDTRTRAIELYEELEQKLPDDKPADRWGRVHKLLELETEAVESSI